MSQYENTGRKNSRVFHSKKQREAQKEEERLSRECSRKKCKKKEQCAIYRGTGPRKAKCPNKLSLKRHVAWEYPESAARHKGLFWLPHPHSPRGPVRRRDLFSFFKKASYFLTRPFFGKIGKLKRGQCRDPSLWETRGTHLTVTRGTCYQPDHHHPDSPKDTHDHGSPIRTASRKGK